jgi:signal transduction histidine kinase
MMPHAVAAPPIDRHVVRDFAPGSQAVGSPVMDILVHRGDPQAKQSWRAREIEVLEDERRRLARDLHDEAGHRLTAVVLKLDAVAQQYGDDAELRESLDAARHLICECAAGLHEVAFNLRPSILADLGLLPAVRSLTRRAAESTGLSVTVELTGTPRRFPEGVELAAFRIVQEALTNVMKYAKASAVTVQTTFTESDVRIDISDDGLGFESVGSDAGRPRLGLTGIRERAELVGGEMRIQTKLGQGTTVSVRLPWTEVES